MNILFRKHKKVVSDIVKKAQFQNCLYGYMWPVFYLALYSCLAICPTSPEVWTSSS